VLWRTVIQTQTQIQTQFIQPDRQIIAISKRQKCNFIMALCILNV